LLAKITVSTRNKKKLDHAYARLNQYKSLSEHRAC